MTIAPSSAVVHPKSLAYIFITLTCPDTRTTRYVSPGAIDCLPLAFERSGLSHSGPGRIVTGADGVFKNGRFAT